MIKSAALLFFLILIPFANVHCQTGIKSDGSNADNSAVLDVSSAEKGFLPPRVALVSAEVSTPVPTPATGLIVYNTASSGSLPNSVCPGLYFWSGQRWIRFNDGVVCGYETLPLPDACVPSGIVTDVEGNTYNTRIIGNQEWMAENLRVTKYRDGTEIPHVTIAADWTPLLTGGWCYYDNDIANRDIYGSLYNWRAVYHNGLYDLCPSGWHVPSDQDWTELTDFLEGETVAGGKMKETGTSHWFPPNMGAVNTTCFSGKPGGWREIDGSFNALGEWGLFWSSDTAWYGDPWYRRLLSNLAKVNRYTYDKRAGHSVRCIRDCTPPSQSDAGSDQINLPGTSVMLNPGLPQSGFGYWSIVYGFGGSIVNPLNPHSIFSGLPAHYYKLRWAVYTDCQTSIDEVEISFQCPVPPTTANAGPDQLNINALSTTLQGNAPSSGTGQWSIVSGKGGSFADEFNPLTLFTGIEGRSYTLRWTIIACSSSHDDVVISFSCPAANAGPDQIQVPGNSTTLQATAPFAGTGHWAIVSGSGGTIADPSNPNSTFTGIPGVNYQLNWTVTSQCPEVVDQVIISFQCSPQPTQAYAGPDQTNVAGVTTTLQGNTPVYGTGMWSIASGTSGIIAQPNNPASMFTGTNGTTYVLVWGIVNSCGSTSDYVTISFAPFSCGNAFLDTRDNKIYTTVQRGSQCWMKQNLNYATGTSTCYAGNPANCDNYGRLYDWNTASTACPTGWHLPTDQEWCTLANGIDGTVSCGVFGVTGTDAGGKMKETGTTYWQAPNYGATNSSGFSARGAGSTTIAGRYLNQWGSFWTSTAYGANKWSWEMYYADQKIWHTYYGTSNTMSVRCLKN